MKKLRFIIADDHPLFRSGLRAVISVLDFVSDIIEVGSGQELLQLLRLDANFDVILLDVFMPDGSGREVCEIISKSYPQIKIVAISFSDSEETIQAMFHAGANGYIIKSSGKENIIRVIDLVVNAEVNYKPIGNKSGISKHNNRELAIQKIIETERMRDIIYLLCQELSNVEMGDMLCVSPRTIEYYRNKLIDITDARNSIGLAKFAMDNVILTDSKLISKWQEKVKLYLESHPK